MLGQALCAMLGDHAAEECARVVVVGYGGERTGRGPWRRQRGSRF